MPDFEVGKTYEISHSRKGKFVAKIVSVETPWVHCRIVCGDAKMLSPLTRNKGAGDSLVFRDSLTQIIREIETPT
ncbi:MULTISPECIES: hypothetical protein [Halocynthiibacter]|uniref:Uncharacterized protein n=1 Tax=Halocynthiibacter halioticoli TaxID=2986804 RepID=A0AAE3J4X5_9RHOB|nr:MULTISPECIES: hypothetical protein [Halocynthiibacter]MCV6826037.1 hypothetical protein [Halocynthiibacter halioticoli]MCW4059038.1 hypothetical protein [Halocynthiibacter sp. SDUM655004]